MKQRLDKSLTLLKEIYELVDNEQAILESDIQTPICVPDCGKCCVINTITVDGVEGRTVVQWLRQQPRKTQQKVLRVCYKWLTQKDKYVGLRKGIGTTNCTPFEIDRANNEALYIFMKTPCPLLDKDKTCMIHPVRPLTCRVFGIFRIVSQEVCPRPPGRYETDIFRAYRKDTEGHLLIKEKMAQLKLSMNGKYRVNNLLIAPAIYSEMEPQKFMDLMYWGRIPTARFLFFNATTILWQDQWQEILDRENEVKFLCEPIPVAGEKKDVTMDYIQHVKSLDKIIVTPELVVKDSERGGQNADKKAQPQN